MVVKTLFLDSLLVSSFPSAFASLSYFTTLARKSKCGTFDLVGHYIVQSYEQNYCLRSALGHSICISSSSLDVSGFPLPSIDTNQKHAYRRQLALILFVSFRDSTKVFIWNRFPCIPWDVSVLIRFTMLGLSCVCSKIWIAIWLLR
jgi:hypothetical protein